MSTPWNDEERGTAGSEPRGNGIDPAQAHPRKPYRAPRLEPLGEVAAITMGSPAPNIESGGETGLA